MEHAATVTWEIFKSFTAFLCGALFGILVFAPRSLPAVLFASLVKPEPVQASGYSRAGFSESKLRTLLKHGKHDAAVERLRTVVRRRPENIPARVLMAKLLHKHSRYREAAEVLRPAYRAQPNDPKLAMLFGTSLLRAGQPLEAVGPFEAVLAIRPDSLEAQNLLGISRLENSDYTKAIEVFDRIIAHNGTNAAAFNNKGIALLSRAKFDEAVRSFRKAIELDPALLAAHDNLRMLYRKLDRELPPEKLMELYPGTGLLHTAAAANQSKKESAEPKLYKVTVARRNRPGTTVLFTNIAERLDPLARGGSAGGVQ